MPHYNGRWYRYTDPERREYGERQREELSRNWHALWISRAGLKDRFWTDKAIADFLGPPLKAGSISAWTRNEVLATEKTTEFRNWMEKRRAWLDTRCRLQDIAYASYGLLAIGWDISAPEKPVRFQELVWNEKNQDLVDYSHKWINSPFTGAEFNGWEPDEVACAICEWFISQSQESNILVNKP